MPFLSLSSPDHYSKVPLTSLYSHMHHILAVACNHVTERVVSFAVMMKPNKTEISVCSCLHYM